MTARTPLVSTAELAARLGDPSWVVIDCRHDLAQPHAGRAAWAAGHIPGARFIGLDDDLAGPRTGANGRHPLPDPAVAAARLGALGIDATKQVVAYDAQSMSNAARVWWTLRWLGHDAVAVLDGGWNAWVAEGRPVTDAVPAIAPANFVPRLDAGLAVDTAFVAARLRTPQMTLVDARSAERYRGEKEPIDPVAGHIPGALNRFVGENLAADGRFRAADELRRGWSTLLGDRAPETLVHSCGSGVAACQNMLSLAVAGLPTGRLYPGSWSEWIADPSRPRATGAEP
jgi:thiosulfate/3-mercaptopyruvate sulfurtransferase